MLWGNISDKMIGNGVKMEAGADQRLMREKRHPSFPLNLKKQIGFC